MWTLRALTQQRNIRVSNSRAKRVGPERSPGCAALVTHRSPPGSCDWTLAGRVCRAGFIVAAPSRRCSAGWRCGRPAAPPPTPGRALAARTWTCPPERGKWGDNTQLIYTGALASESANRNPTDPYAGRRARARDVPRSVPKRSLPYNPLRHFDSTSTHRKSESAAAHTTASQQASGALLERGCTSFLEIRAGEQASGDARTNDCDSAAAARRKHVVTQ